MQKRQPSLPARRVPEKTTALQSVPTEGNMEVSHVGRSLLYGGLFFGAATCDALAKLSHDQIWFGGSIFAVPALFDCFLRWYALRNREWRDTRLIQMIEQQQTAILGITGALSASKTLDASIASLEALKCATRDLAKLLATSDLAETRAGTPNRMFRIGRTNDECQR
jgi:hypothetical protein